MGALLDTHALYWLVSEAEPLSEDALIAIFEAQTEDRLYVSPITAWELGVASRKVVNRPDFGALSPSLWFRDAVRATGARIVPIRQRIALESAKGVAQTGHRDPGDCFLIATAKTLRVPIITRDGQIQTIARDHPDYLTVQPC